MESDRREKRAQNLARRRATLECDTDYLQKTGNVNSWNVRESEREREQWIGPAASSETRRRKDKTTVFKFNRSNRKLNFKTEHRGSDPDGFLDRFTRSNYARLSSLP